MKQGSALGFIETEGLSAAIAAADAAVKSANVRLIGRELTKGQGCVTVKIAGDVAAVRAAIDAAKAAAEKVSRTESTDVIPRPAARLAEVMVQNSETTGQPQAMSPVPVADFPLAVSAPAPVKTLPGPQRTAATPEPEPVAEAKPEPAPATAPEAKTEPEQATKPDDAPEETPIKESEQEKTGAGQTTGQPDGEKQDGAGGKPTPPRGKQPRGKRKR